MKEVIWRLTGNFNKNILVLYLFEQMQKERVFEEDKHTKEEKTKTNKHGGDKA